MTRYALLCYYYLYYYTLLYYYYITVYVFLYVELRLGECVDTPRVAASCWRRIPVDMSARPVNDTM